MFRAREIKNSRAEAPPLPVVALPGLIELALGRVRPRPGPRRGEPVLELAQLGASGSELRLEWLIRAA